MTDALLKEVIQELRLLREEVRGNRLTTCNASEALALLGLPQNTRYLTYFCREGMLDRRTSGKGFIYYKNEITILAEKLKSKEILLPAIKTIYA